MQKCKDGIKGTIAEAVIVITKTGEQGQKNCRIKVLTAQGRFRLKIN